MFVVMPLILVLNLRFSLILKARSKCHGMYSGSRRYLKNADCYVLGVLTQTERNEYYILVGLWQTDCCRLTVLFDMHLGKRFSCQIGMVR